MFTEKEIEAFKLYPPERIEFISHNKGIRIDTFNGEYYEVDNGGSKYSIEDMIKTMKDDGFSPTYTIALKEAIKISIFKNEINEIINSND